jgi:hypothetical protein
MRKLFTERHGPAKPRIAEVLDDTTRNGLLTLVSARIGEEWFGLSFPNKCGDGYAYAGTDFDKLCETMKGYGLLWPVAVDRREPPDDGQIFDYDRDSGRENFTYDVNRLFERNGMAFELAHGEVIRTAPAALHEALAESVFMTGDATLDELLEAARQKFLNRSLDVRRESLEKLWDAWERLKTLEPGKDKKASANALLDRAAAEPLRSRLEQEARELTDIGNTFMIRHTETDKVPVVDSAHVDYLFHRMFSLIRLLLKASGRGG